MSLNKHQIFILMLMHLGSVVSAYLFQPLSLLLYAVYPIWQFHSTFQCSSCIVSSNWTQQLVKDPHLFRATYSASHNKSQS